MKASEFSTFTSVWCFQHCLIIMIVVSQNFSLNVWTHPEVVELREDDYQQFTVSQAPRDKNCFQEHRTHRSRSGRKTIRLNESLHHISRVSTCSEQLQSWGAKSGVLGAETSSPGGWSQLSWGLKPAVLGAKASSPGGQSQRSWGPKPGVLRAKVRSLEGQSQESWGPKPDCHTDVMSCALFGKICLFMWNVCLRLCDSYSQVLIGR